MRKPISILLWVVLAVALVMLPAPACAGWGYSAVDVFSTTVVGTSTTYLDSWEFYDGNHPYVEGTLMREWETLGSNYQFNEYDSFVSVQVYAALEPGNALYSMDGGHFAGLDQWNLNYLGYSEGWYYYFDPAAWPPYIYGISPNVGVSGSSGYIPIYGAYLAPQGTTPVVSMDGATLWIVYQSDNQINVYYSNVSLGTHWLSVTTIYGTSNYVQFTAVAGDATPSITSISPEEWEAGATTNFSIAGTGFGTNPGLTITGGWIDNYGVYSAWDTGINAWVTVSPYAPDETVTVSVTSNGYWGNSFMEQYPNQPHSGSANAQVRGGVLTSVSQTPQTLSLSTGDTRSITTNVTPSGTPINVSYSQFLYGNPHGSCTVVLDVEPRSGTGSATSPVHKSSGSSSECSGIYWVRATASSTSSTRESGNYTSVIVPPQKLIQVLYGESHGQTDIGDYTSQVAIGTTIRNRFGDPDHFSGVTTYQAAITPDQFMGIATSITNGPSPDLEHAAGIYYESLGTDVAGATCFFSPTHPGWVAIQDALNSGTTTVPTVAFDPQCYSSARQFVVKLSVGNNADGRGAPAFIFLRQRASPSTEPAVLQIP